MNGATPSLMAWRVCSRPVVPTRSEASHYRAPDHISPDGFYVPGDLVVRDSRGYLTVTGRINDIINRGGEKVASETVEAEVHGGDGAANCPATDRKGQT